MENVVSEEVEAVDVDTQEFSNFAGEIVLRYKRQVEQKEAKERAMRRLIVRDTKLRKQTRAVAGIHNT